MVEPVERDSRGILHPRAGLRRFELTRFPPSPGVDRFVDRYWFVSWDLPEVYEQDVLVHPVVNVVFADDGGTVTGVRTERLTRRLSGRGRALGVMFRPGGFRPFLGRPLATITDTVRPLADGFPALHPAEPAVMAALADGTDGAEIAKLVDAALAPLVPDERQPSEDTTALAELAARDRDLRRVEDLAARGGLSVRQLQRAFADHVGVSPKWVLRRYRIYDAAERAARAETVDWAALAADLGYADQAHLTREFTAVVGEPPGRYARRS
ncbi:MULTISPECIES: helix-turn-helix domain-containing protein [Amycolatopsis]|uniref:AraC family transcriptional regulator n=1 Tax=Amycolatopsis thermalba TaxID=944492 RepID=A0ABY4P3M0_9PSEU|nr:MULTISPECIES: AraC family transcriptional regulator [Amycolatopsis]OXM71417.1 AraC family transcriptional regulator [Amycolatopsis sp. KNN50.9b]UQS26894.1 AraC family transcriptional regulator [Amycolatopsis thermalba]